MFAILGMTELTLDTPLAEDHRQYLKTVKSAVEERRPRGLPGGQYV